MRPSTHFYSYEDVAVTLLKASLGESESPNGGRSGPGQDAL